MALMLSRKGFYAHMDLPFNNSLDVRIGTDPTQIDAAVFAAARNTHLWLLFHAASRLKNKGTVGRRLHQLIRPWEGWLNDDFHDALCCGLWDADKKAPYNNPVLEVVPTWKSHFYDPDTQTNWLGEFQPTAVSEGITYYREAQRAFRREHWQEAGHKLGVALHYLTDLTQPMHAANFTWLDSLSFGYHTDFERYVKNMLPRIKPPKVYAPRLNETRYKRYFHAVARYSKDTYFALLCKPEWTQHYTNEARAEKVWDARVGTLVPHILSDAVQMTAQFLLLWFTEALTSPQH